LEALVTPHDPASALVLFLLIVTVGYLLTCAIWPFGTCRRCHGDGTLRGPLGGRRYCRRCQHTGLRIRVGRHLWNVLARLYRDSKPARRP
jgi:hypothetical protein